MSIIAVVLAAASPSATSSATSMDHGSPRCHMLSRAQMEKLQSTYRGRAMLQGKAKADEWLRGQCGGMSEEVAQDAVDRNADDRTPSRTARSSDRRNGSGKGCKMVMRPVAGFGGAMTMAMVPDCK